LLKEIQAFVHAVQSDSAPPISGQEGREALALAQEILEVMRKAKV
jgi:predicted dehydrogenase